MAVWLVRAGKTGEAEALALDKNVVTIGWEELPDLSGARSSNDIRDLCKEFYPNVPQGRIANSTGQVWGFVGRIQPNDLVVLPLKTHSAIAVGRVTGPYQYRMDFPFGAKHTRPVQWIRKDIPRTAFGQDLLYSLGAFMTVCNIRRNNAETRIEQVIRSGKDNIGALQLPAAENDTDAEPEPLLDIEQYARDQLRAFISAHFNGHEFTRLINEVLRAQGYHTRVMQPGRDGGVDILAGQGPMGFDAPRLAVQVKSSDSPENVNTLRELQGVMKNMNAQQGLLVSWGGFKDTVYKEAQTLFFELRLWDADNFLQALLSHYDKLSDNIQAELPLKRVWTLVVEDE